MATVSKDENKQQTSMKGSQQQNIQGVGSPITNEAYNVIAALHAKLEGLEAYRKFAKDADVPVWQQLTQIELKSVQTLVGELERIVNEGKLRMQEPGRAKS